MKKVMTLGIFWLCGLCLLAAQAQAATYWVRPTGTMSGCTSSASAPANDSGYKSTVAAGIACMAGGDTLYIRGGTYDERLDEFLGVTYPQGTSAWNTIISAYPGETVTIAPSNNSTDSIIQAITERPSVKDHYLTFADLILDCTHVTGSASCIKTADGARHLRFQNLEVKNTGQATWTTVDSGCGYLLGGTGPGTATFPEIIGGSIHGNGWVPSGHANNACYGIYTGAGGTLVDGVDIYQNGGFGIQALDDAHGGADNMVIKNNRIHDNSYNSNNDWAGIVVGSGNNQQVYNNLIYNNGSNIGGGLIIWSSCTNCKVYNNSIYEPSGTGPGIDNRHGATLQNNIIYTPNSNNPIGNCAAAGDCASSSGDHNYCSAFGNLCPGTGTINSTTNPFASTTPGNPNFLQLTTCSGTDCPLDKGVNLTSLGIRTDFAGNARPLTAPWDLGAYEYSAPAAAPQLVAAYGFDSIEGQTVYDSSGLNNNGTMDATVVVDSSGKYGKALLFNGTNTVTVPNSASLSFTDGLTIEAWVNVPTAPTTPTAVMAKFYDYYLYVNSEPWQCAGQRAFGGAVTSGQGQIVCDSTSGFPANTWVHLAVTYDGSTFLFYRDGQITNSRAGNGAMTASSGPLYIGNSGFPEYFTGKIDEVRIYTGALTQSQIQFDMTNPITPIVPPEKIIQIAPPNTLELSATDGALQIGE